MGGSRQLRVRDSAIVALARNRAFTHVLESRRVNLSIVVDLDSSRLALIRTQADEIVHAIIVDVEPADVFSPAVGLNVKLSTLSVLPIDELVNVDALVVNRVQALLRIATNDLSSLARLNGVEEVLRRVDLRRVAGDVLGAGSSTGALVRRLKHMRFVSLLESSHPDGCHLLVAGVSGVRAVGVEVLGVEPRGVRLVHFGKDNALVSFAAAFYNGAVLRVDDFDIFVGLAVAVFEDGGEEDSDAGDFGVDHVKHFVHALMNGLDGELSLVLDCVVGSGTVVLLVGEFLISNQLATYLIVMRLGWYLTASSAT
jgi:hypothetical protein